MKKLLPILAGTMALTTVSSFSYAAMSDDDAGLYVGGNYGYVKIDGEDEFDDNNDSLQAIVGLKFNQYVGIEGSYIDFGSYGNDLANAETDGYTAAVKLTAPVADRVEVYAKGGQIWYNTDYEFAGLTGDQEDEAVFAGAGVGFKVTDNFVVNAEYNWYDIDADANAVADGAETDTDFRQVSVGAEFRY